MFNLWIICMHVIRGEVCVACDIEIPNECLYVIYLASVSSQPAWGNLFLTCNLHACYMQLARLLHACYFLVACPVYVTCTVIPICMQLAFCLCRNSYAVNTCTTNADSNHATCLSWHICTSNTNTISCRANYNSLLMTWQMSDQTNGLSGISKCWQDITLHRSTQRF